MATPSVERQQDTTIVPCCPSTGLEAIPLRTDD
jgi:hypothetical protein